MPIPLRAGTRQASSTRDRRAEGADVIIGAAPSSFLIGRFAASAAGYLEKLNSGS